MFFLLFITFVFRVEGFQGFGVEGSWFGVCWWGFEILGFRAFRVQGLRFGLEFSGVEFGMSAKRQKETSSSTMVPSRRWWRRPRLALKLKDFRFPDRLRAVCDGGVITPPKAKEQEDRELLV